MTSGGARLALGTVQLGMSYGIANSLGQPDAPTAHAILDEARRLGIRDLDTASGYGTSESVLGSWESRKDCRIVSKFSAPAGAHPRPSDLEAGLRASLGRLDMPRLHGYLLHDPALVFEADWIRALARAKDTGLVEKVGVSVYEPDQAMEAVRDPLVDFVQIPYNALDHRLDETPFFEVALDRGIEIWTRSTFLQGLLLMDADRVPHDLAEVLPLRATLESIAARHGYDLATAALLHPLSRPGVSAALVGVESVVQLRALAAVPARLDGFRECRDEMAAALAGRVSPYLVSPQKWRKR